MDKKAIKAFAMESRVKLRTDVINKLAKLGITEKGIEDVIEIGNDTIEIASTHERFVGKAIHNRTKLVEALYKREKQMDPKETKSFAIAFDNLVEEVAYTWFNRLIAIRFMEVNNYLPGRQRVLSSEIAGKKEPDIITNILSSDLYQDMNPITQNQVVELLSDNSADAVDELYQLVFIKQCNSLNQQLPDLFEKLDDYTELLFTISYIDENGIIAKLLTIPEEDFDVEQEGQVEIIGWMYQYYNTEPKDKVFARGKRKIRSDEIPAATQLFTPDWIVRYMVENSLGRYYIDQKMGNPLETRTEKEIADEFGWKYYLPTAEQPEDVQLQIRDERKKKSVISLQEIKLIDPSMGSGHILVYAFDVFIQLYLVEGFRERDAVESILKNNLFGLDIDKRAFQLTYFALMMKARHYSRRILSKNIKPHIYAVPDNFGIGESELQLLQLNFPNKEKAYQDLIQLIEGFKIGTELGSLIEFKGIDFKNLKIGLIDGEISFIDHAIREMIYVGELLQQKYTIGITNPPYMGSSGMDKVLATYVKKYYPNSKSDLFGVFIERIEKMIESSGYYALITQHAWMFLSSFEKLRININQQTLINMAHLGTRAFEEIGGEVVQTTAFILSPIKNKNYIGSYSRLVDFNNHQLKEIKFLESIDNNNVDFLYHTNQDNFAKIPGQPLSFWVSENLISAFILGNRMEEMISPKIGMRTGNNTRFLRQWYEVSSVNTNLINASIESTQQNITWVPYNKGGSFRRWYGNYDYVVNWLNNGNEIKENTRRVYPQIGENLSWKITNESFYFLPSITWPAITSGKLSMRYRKKGSIFDVAGMSAFSSDDKLLYYILGLGNSNVGDYLLKILNPTINAQVGDFKNIPVLYEENIESLSITRVKENISLAKDDWDLNEISWDFKKNTLI